MKTVLVTGAEGFTGKHMVRHLRASGYDVVAGVRNRARKLASERQSTRAIVCDVSDAISVARAVASAKPEGIIHLAGTSLPADAAEEPLGAYQSIVTAWANVLDAVRRAVPRARVLLVSAADVYGDAGADGRPISEATASQPVGTFGSLKAAAESIARTFFFSYHLNISIARPFHYVGSGQSPRFFFANVACRLTENNGQPIELCLPDLNCRRDVLCVTDVVEAYEKLLLDGKPNQIYNVCSGKASTVREIVEELATTANRPIRLSDATVADEGTIRCLCGDHSRITAETGWKPRLTLHDAIASLLSSPVPCGAAQSAAARGSAGVQAL